jgi:hypothetical protein
MKSSILPVILGVIAVAIPTGAQSCWPCPGPGEVALQNDTLAPIIGSQPISVIQGLCDGEACGAVFDVSAVGPVVKVNCAGCPYGGAAAGNQALVELRIYDGVSWSGGIPLLGPEVWNSTTALGINIQVTSTGVSFFDLSAYNVTVSSGTLVIAWFMGFNGDPAGSCATGYPHNFFTDNSTASPFATCDPLITPPMRNLIYIQGQGWRDATNAVVSGFPLCPAFYAGNWAIRGCVENAAPSNPRQLQVQTNPISWGGFSFVTFTTPTSDVGNLYAAVVSLAATPPTPTPWGIFPLPTIGDPLAEWWLFSGDPARLTLFQGFSGVVPPGGVAPGTISLLGLGGQGLPPLGLHTAFMTFDPVAGAATGFSDAVSIAIQ